MRLLSEVSSEGHAHLFEVLSVPMGGYALKMVGIYATGYNLSNVVLTCDNSNITTMSLRRSFPCSHGSLLQRMSRLPPTRRSEPER